MPTRGSSAVDGTDTILPPPIFRTAVARLLGQPVFSEPVPCPLCEQIMDLNGDHALCCKKSGDRITRHNRLRNLVFKLADTGLLRPEMEKLGILGVTDVVDLEMSPLKTGAYGVASP